jgi:aminomethyltransferase
LSETLSKTPLHAAHLAAGARMVAFAGYDMPVQYRDGVLREHLWTRAHAGAFDVSHMGPSIVSLAKRSGDPDADHRAVSAIVEPLLSGDIATLAPGQLRYTLMLNEQGGLIDDLMVGRPAEAERQGELYVVVNAATKDGDFALLAGAGAVRLARLDDHALIAIQGPEAAAVLQVLLPEAAELRFMRFARLALHGQPVIVSRCGYTGEDGFEMLVPPSIARAVWDGLLADDRVRPIGLGARDSLRLEAGLPLYGHDADETVSPFEAGLGFAVSKARLRHGRIRGAGRLAREHAGGLTRVRVGLKVVQGAPAREGAEITDAAGETIGRVTSGGFSPCLSAPIAMGFVPPIHARAGAALEVIVRGKSQPAEVTHLPFVPHRYVRTL